VAAQAVYDLYNVIKDARTATTIEIMEVVIDWCTCEKEKACAIYPHLRVKFEEVDEPYANMIVSQICKHCRGLSREEMAEQAGMQVDSILSGYGFPGGVVQDYDMFGMGGEFVPVTVSSEGEE